MCCTLYLVQTLLLRTALYEQVMFRRCLRYSTSISFNDEFSCVNISYNRELQINSYISGCKFQGNIPVVLRFVYEHLRIEYIRWQSLSLQNLDYFSNMVLLLDLLPLWKLRIITTARIFQDFDDCAKAQRLGYGQVSKNFPVQGDV